MTTTVETTIEAQLTALQAQMDLLMQTYKRPLSPVKQMEKIRRNYREQYFGSWEEMRDGETQYGPSGKSYSDYDTIMQIISKTSGLLFKYSRGQASRSASLSELVKTDEDIKDYEVICEAACKGLMDGIKHFSAAKSLIEKNGNRYKLLYQKGRRDAKSLEGSPPKGGHDTAADGGQAGN